jgi:ubiquinone/menaquinone biosynthesis C-methylase UbiE
MSALTHFEHMVKTKLGMAAYGRMTRWVYDRVYRAPDWDTVSTYNYGYGEVEEAVARAWPAEPHQIQLYAEVVKAIAEIASAPRPGRLLEAGCGRGGGLAYLRRSLAPETTIGLDRSLPALRFALEKHPGARYVAGNATQLPAAANSIDIVVSVEAMHDFPKPPFFSEVARVLAVGGVFAVADSVQLSTEAARGTLAGLLADAGMALKYFRDITQNVFVSCRDDAARRRRLLSRSPWYYRALGREMLCLPDSTRYGEFERHARCYFIAIAGRWDAR